MTRHTQLDPLLEPFALKHLTLRNRVVSTSHEPAYSVHGLPTERYIAYHVEKARGGVGLTMIGGSAVRFPNDGVLSGETTADPPIIVSPTQPLAFSTW